MNSSGRNQLLDEKKLWNIYTKSRAIPRSEFNFWTTIAVFVMVILDLLFGNRDTREIYVVLKMFEVNGLLISLSTLAFLVAGYTIFATVTQPSLSLAMNEHTNSISGLSSLKHNHFLFLRVFIYYLTYAVFCILLMLFGYDNGLMHRLVSLLPSSSILADVLVRFAYCVLYVGLYFLVMQLKSFIYNLYHAVMTALTWEKNKCGF